MIEFAVHGKVVWCVLYSKNHDLVFGVLLVKYGRKCFAYLSMLSDLQKEFSYSAFGL